jgi:zinc metalloprotease ZmpB
VFSIYNNYHYDIPSSLDPKKIKIQEEEAVQMVTKMLSNYKKPEFIEKPLVVYQYYKVDNQPPKGVDVNSIRSQFLQNVANIRQGNSTSESAKVGQYFLAWDIRVLIGNPNHFWRILIDAMAGNVIQVIDLLQYASGSSEVFDPNPIVSSGNIALRHTDAAATINAQRSSVTVDRLKAADGAGNLHLDGSYVVMQDFAAPTVAEPASPTGDFKFSFDDNSFLNAMVYFHLDRFQNYIQTELAMNNVANYAITVDPQGTGGADNSDYNSANKRIEYGGGIVPVPSDNPVPDAADAMVVLHEYGHAIQDNVNPGFDNPIDGTGEGFGDFLAAIFYDDKHTNPGATRGFMMSWDSEMGTGSWAGRRYDVNWHFTDAQYTGSSDNHTRGQLWCASMFEIYRKLGGDSVYSWVKSSAKDLTIRLHLMANFNVPASNSSATQMAQQVEAADSNLAGWRYPKGLHRKVIYDVFRRRLLSMFPDLTTDVYINDGRMGGYGSVSGNDLFTEKLFLDNYWETQDLWVKVTPYANDAAQQAGDPGDHVEPPVGQTAYLYVRVKNLGTGNSGPLNVRAFHSDPSIGLVWPVDWNAMTTPSISVSNLPSNGHTIVGPFPWVPTLVGHECVFAIVECANDHAVTQDLLSTDMVAHADLVPFDNNIAQRNLAPTASKDKMTRGFWVKNPLDRFGVVKLDFDSSLPRGWTYQTNLPNTDAIPLRPGERRWVELTIDQASGGEVTDFSNPPKLIITGSIDNKLIGGMSFYTAPASAFPKPTGSTTGDECNKGVLKPSDLFCLNIPWKDCDIEGEIDIKLKFHCKKC